MYITSKTFTQINSALIPKARNGLSGVGIQGVEEIHHANENAMVITAFPIRQASIRLCALDTRTKFPLQLSGRGIHGKDLLRRRDSIKNAMNHDRTSLQSASLLRVECPRNLQLLYILSINLSKFRVVPALGSAAINGPVAVTGAGQLEGNQGQEQERSNTHDSGVVPESALHGQA